MKKMNKGFTLVEALIVIILIALGAALAFSFLGNPTKEGRTTADAATFARDVTAVNEGINKDYTSNGTWDATYAALVSNGTLKAVPPSIPAAGAPVTVGNAQYIVSNVVPSLDSCQAFNQKYAGKQLADVPAKMTTLAADQLDLGGATVSVLECVANADASEYRVVSMIHP